MPIIITCKRQSGSQLFSLICLLRNRHVGPKLSTFPPLGPLHYPWVLNVVFKCFANIRISDQIAFLCVHTPRGHIHLRFLPPHVSRLVFITCFALIFLFSSRVSLSSFLSLYSAYPFQPGLFMVFSAPNLVFTKIICSLF